MADGKTPLTVGIALATIGLVFYTVSFSSSAWIKYEEKDQDDVRPSDSTTRFGLWERCRCVNAHNLFKLSKEQRQYISAEDREELPGFYIGCEVLAVFSMLQLWCLLVARPSVYIKLVLCGLAALFLLLTVAVFGDQFRKAPEFDGYDNDVTGVDWSMGLALIAMFLCIGAGVASAYELLCDNPLSNPSRRADQPMQTVH